MLLAIALLSIGCSPLASKGTMPPPGPNGEADASDAPDFIAVAGSEADVVGYVPKRFMFPERTTTGIPQLEPWPVYADDLRTLIGHMVPGKGFVPLGVDPDTVPDIPVQQGPSAAAPTGASNELTIYVRNVFANSISLAVRIDGTTAGPSYNFGGGTGVACVGIGTGGRLVLLDRPPQDAGVKILREMYVQGETGASPTLWIDIDAKGAINQGRGVPAWWSGYPQAC